MRKAPITSASRIGVRVIMAKPGTSPRQSPPQPANEFNADASATAEQTPPPPGLGKLLDKTV
jgi:hypothetical protein